MKPQMIIIFSIVFSIYFLANWYLYSRGLKAIETTDYRRLFTWMFWTLAISFPLGQFLERGNPNDFFRMISYAGSFWLVILWYSLIMVAVIDIVRLTDGWFHFVPAGWKTSFMSGKIIFLAVLGISSLLLIGGHINALFPKINKLEISINKSAKSKQEIKAVLLTDIHMGAIIQNIRIKRMVNMINELSPDIILLAGDLVDHNPIPVIEKKMGEHFRELNPELGIFAVAGNHEFIGHASVSIDYLSQFGIKYLRDTLVEVDGIINIAGRDDREKPRFEEGNQRKQLETIINGHDPDLPLILLDHQPVDYAKAGSAKVDLMLSGHTHHGQIWPFNYLTSAIYENDFGLIKKGKSYFYTSSGFGTWGPPVRIGNRPEIVDITIKLK